MRSRKKSKAFFSIMKGFDHKSVKFSSMKIPFFLRINHGSPTPHLPKNPRTAVAILRELGKLELAGRIQSKFGLAEEMTGEKRLPTRVLAPLKKKEDAPAEWRPRILRIDNRRGKTVSARIASHRDVAFTRDGLERVYSGDGPVFDRLVKAFDSGVGVRASLLVGPRYLIPKPGGIDVVAESDISGLPANPVRVYPVFSPQDLEWIWAFERTGNQIKSVRELFKLSGRPGALEIIDETRFGKFEMPLGVIEIRKILMAWKIGINIDDLALSKFGFLNVSSERGAPTDFIRFFEEALAKVPLAYNVKVLPGLPEVEFSYRSGMAGPAISATGWTVLALFDYYAARHLTDKPFEIERNALRRVLSRVVVHAGGNPPRGMLNIYSRETFERFFDGPENLVFPLIQKAADSIRDSKSRAKKIGPDSGHLFVPVLYPNAAGLLYIQEEDIPLFAWAFGIPLKEGIEQFYDVDRGVELPLDSDEIIALAPADQRERVEPMIRKILAELGDPTSENPAAALGMTGEVFVYARKNPAGKLIWAIQRDSVKGLLETVGVSLPSISGNTMILPNETATAPNNKQPPARLHGNEIAITPASQQRDLVKLIGSEEKTRAFVEALTDILERGYDGEHFVPLLNPSGTKRVNFRKWFYAKKTALAFKREDFPLIIEILKERGVGIDMELREVNERPVPVLDDSGRRAESPFDVLLEPNHLNNIYLASRVTDVLPDVTGILDRLSAGGGLKPRFLDLRDRVVEVVDTIPEGAPEDQFLSVYPVYSIDNTTRWAFELTTANVSAFAIKMGWDVRPATILGSNEMLLQNLPRSLGLTGAHKMALRLLRQLIDSDMRQGNMLPLHAIEPHFLRGLPNVPILSRDLGFAVPDRSSILPLLEPAEERVLNRRIAVLFARRNAVHDQTQARQVDFENEIHVQVPRRFSFGNEIDVVAGEPADECRIVSGREDPDRYFFRLARLVKSNAARAALLKADRVLGHLRVKHPIRFVQFDTDAGFLAEHDDVHARIALEFLPLFIFVVGIAVDEDDLETFALIVSDDRGHNFHVARHDHAFAQAAVMVQHPIVHGLPDPIVGARDHFAEHFRKQGEIHEHALEKIVHALVHVVLLRRGNARIVDGQIRFQIFQYGKQELRVRDRQLNAHARDRSEATVKIPKVLAAAPDHHRREQCEEIVVDGPAALQELRIGLFGLEDRVCRFAGQWVPVDQAHQTVKLAQMARVGRGR